MRYDVTGKERYLMLGVLAAYPALSLLIRGWVNALFLITLIVSVVFLTRTKRWMDKATWDISAAAFALTMTSYTAAILLSQLYRQEFKWTPYDEALRLLLAVPIYLAIRAANLKMTSVVGVSCSLGAIFALLAAGWDLQAGNHRLGSYFLNVIHFGNIALILGFLGLFSMDTRQERSLWLAVLKIAGLCAGLYLSFRSGTRGGWLAIPALLVIWVFTRHRTKFHAAMLLTFSVGVAAIVGYSMTDVIGQRLLDLQSDLVAFSQGNKDTSVGIRLQLIQAVFMVIEGSPLFGVGPDGYKNALAALAQSAIITPLAMEMGIAEVHNQILNYAVKYGLLGLVAGIAIHFVPLVIFVRRLRIADGEGRTASLMGLCLVTGFFIFGLSVEIFNLKSTITFYSLTLAVLLASATHHDEDVTRQGQ